MINTKIVVIARYYNRFLDWCHLTNKNKDNFHYAHDITHVYGLRPKEVYLLADWYADDDKVKIVQYLKDNDFDKRITFKEIDY